MSARRDIAARSQARRPRQGPPDHPRRPRGGGSRGGHRRRGLRRPRSRPTLRRSPTSSRSRRARVSVVYAADGTRLGSIQSDIRARRSPRRQIPRPMRDATVAVEDRRFYEHDGVDFEGILRAAVKNVEDGQDGPGRLDAHDAARPQPLHRATRRRSSARSARPSSPSSSRTCTRAAGQALDPHQVPQRRARTARSAARPPSASQAGAARSSSTSPRSALTLDAGRAARRPPPGAVAVQPVPRRPRRPRRAATTCCSGWPSRRYITQAGARARRRRGRSACTPQPLLHANAARATSSTTSSRSSSTSYGVEQRPPGRAQDLHDDRPQAPAGRARKRSAASLDLRGPAVARRSSRSTRQRLHQGDGVVAQLRPTRSSTSPPRATASRARRSR